MTLLWQVRLRTIDNFQGEEAKVIPIHMISDIVKLQHLFRLSSCLLSGIQGPWKTWRVEYSCHRATPTLAF